MERSITDLTAAVSLPEASHARRGERLHRVWSGAAALGYRLRLAGVFAAG